MIRQRITREPSGELISDAPLSNDEPMIAFALFVMLFVGFAAGWVVGSGIYSAW